MTVEECRGLAERQTCCRVEVAEAHELLFFILTHGKPRQFAIKQVSSRVWSILGVGWRVAADDLDGEASNVK